jgi:hypothetical protein
MREEVILSEGGRNEAMAGALFEPTFNTHHVRLGCPEKAERIYTLTLAP